MTLAGSQDGTTVASAASESAPHSANDRPRVLAPAPYILLVTLFAGLVLDRFVWLDIVAEVPEIPRTIVGFTLALVGARFSFRGLAALRSRGTHFEPWKPALALATVGIFQRTRNPMYQGLFLLTLGVAFVLRSDWTIIFLVLTAPIVHFGLVRREERYLARKFGDEYLNFMKQVPRYNWLVWPSVVGRSPAKDWLLWLVAATGCFVVVDAGLWLSDQAIQSFEEPGIRTAAFARASVADDASLLTAAKAAGLSRSYRIFGGLYEIRRGDEGMAKVSGWAVERGGSGAPLTVLIFMDGKKVLETKTHGSRLDVTRALDLPAGNAGNVAFEGRVACREGQKLFLAAATARNTFNALKPLECP